MSAGTNQGTAQNPALGVPILLFSTVAFSFSNVLAQIAYDQGLTPPTVLMTRTMAMVVVVLIWAMIGRTHLRYGLTDCAKLWGLGVAFAAINACFLYAILLIPVSLTVLLLYLGPILVGLLSAALGHERLTPLRIMAAGIAFIGLAIALNVGGGDVALAGILLGLATAVGFAINVVGSSRMMLRLPRVGVIFHMMVAVLVVSLIIFVVSGDGALPAHSNAWWALAAVSIGFATAILTFYIGISYLGGPRGALIMNNEPVVTIFVAMLVLGEVLDPVQYVGAAMVIAAVLLVSLERPATTAN